MSLGISRRALLRNTLAITAALGVAPLLEACSGAAPPASSSSSSAASSSQKPPTDSGASTLSQWEQDTYQAALKEGKVVVYGFWNPTLEKMVTDLMGQRYPGLKLETLTSTTAPEKIRTEQQSQQYNADVYIGGLLSGFTLQQMGASEAFKPPAENTAGARWVLPPTTYVSYPQVAYAILGKGILINSQLVAPEHEPKSWKDLLDPFWAGKKIVIDHPSRGGGPGSTWAHWAYEYPDLGREFMVGLKNQDPVLDRGSATPQINAVARGEYYAYIPAFASYLPQAPGAPLKFLWPAPATGGGSASIVVLIKNAPHPNAAKVFMNMTLLPEFQQRQATELWNSPNLVGVPVPDPVVSLEGRKVFIDNEDDTKRAQDWAATVSREIFGD
jgi:iron(III) transport system substrate-binding protein